MAGQAGAERGTAPATPGARGAPPDAAAPGADPDSPAEEPPDDEPPDDEEPSPLVGVSWSWERFVDPVAGGLDIPDPSRYTVRFDAEGVVHVQADCNEGSGSYMILQNEVTVRILRTTERDCGETSLSDEFIDNVNSASSFRLVDDRLLLSLRWDTGVMEFVPDPQQTPAPETP
jgi:heat shock protein HslJ